jgi:DNA-directed RNA polymerase subunit beta'
VKGEKTGSFDDKFDDRIYSHTIATPVLDEKGEVLFEANTVIDIPTLKALNENNVSEVNIRSVLTCETNGGVCKKCYGLDLSTTREVSIGDPVGVVAAQSIGEPGTQLTMRTFHSG